MRGLAQWGPAPTPTPSSSGTWLMSWAWTPSTRKDTAPPPWLVAARQRADAGWPEHLVVGERREVGVPGPHVGRQVRNVLGRVAEHVGTRGVCGTRERGDVVDRADDVRHRADREELGAGEHLF